MDKATSITSREGVLSRIRGYVRESKVEEEVRPNLSEANEAEERTDTTFSTLALNHLERALDISVLLVVVSKPRLPS